MKHTTPEDEWYKISEVLKKERQMKHIITMLWNQRKKYSGIFTEQAIVTIIMMISIVSVLDAYEKYKTPGIPNVEDIILASFMCERSTTQEEINNTFKSMDAIIDNMRKLPYVKFISRGMNLAPYLRDAESYATQVQGMDSITVDGIKTLPLFKFSDQFGASILNVKMEEGEWFNENNHLPDNSMPIVITRQLADKLRWAKAVGKTITYGSKTLTIVGVAEGIKQEPFLPSPEAIVMPSFSSGGYGNRENLVKVKRGTEKDFVAAYHKEFRRNIANEKVEAVTIQMNGVKEMWESKTIIPIALQGIPTLFLFIFTFIGTFGIYRMNSKKRTTEFALRIALGATKSSLMKLVIGESLIITLMAVIPAIALSFSIYQYDAIHATATSITVLIMMLFAIISACYPAWAASNVNTAKALKYE
ncbi:MAG: ABC transporter permease [Dysgonamonadaceae bacterium]|jgi:ABC-type antimicrobial peptide transport system permease subunit|nr:ABC transporter permease [Dysgonamonadaceae bacterium]